MVTTVDSLVRKVVKQLEKLLIAKTGTAFNINYDLILLVPIDRYVMDSRYTLVISAPVFDNMGVRENIVDTLTFLKDHLEEDEYVMVSRVNVMNTNDPIVRNLKYVFSFRQPALEINNFNIGIEIDYAILAKSLVLDKLKEGKAVYLQLTDGNTIPAGIKSFDTKTFELTYYTAKGLRELFPQDSIPRMENRVAESSDDEMIYRGYLARIPLDGIEAIL